MLKRAILVDGNNLLFRSYYATAYSGSLMRNSSGFPTNALFGFISMINKIIEEENPEYMIVAFDKGKTFRHEKYKEYKSGRIKTPEDLTIQFPYARKILTSMGIKYLEVDNYEADDIIGTFSRLANEDKNFDATIISSDKDLLQLISKCVDVKLLKQKDYILYNEKTFKEDYGIDPIRIIDLKSLEGDISDNIPGVKGIGEKTALTLLKQYKTLEGVYENINEIKGKLQEKLINDKENAFFSKELATICLNTPINMSLNDIILTKPNYDELLKIFNELEFNSFIKKLQDKMNIKTNKEELKTSKDFNKIHKPFAFYLELDKVNYHFADIIGMSIYDGNNSYYLNKDEIISNKDIFKFASYTYDLKKSIVVLNKYNIDLSNVKYDAMIGFYLLNKNVNDDISYIAKTYGYNINYYNDIIKNNLTEDIVRKSIFIYETKENTIKSLKENELFYLFNEVEMPVSFVLSDMELNGIKVNKSVLDEMNNEIKIKIDLLSDKIYNYAGEEFNISSPKQLGHILYEKLHLPCKKKKVTNNYTTNHETLIKLRNLHPIINLILEYRELDKLFTTYLESLSSFIKEDGKIHTIYKQTIARTGRLSSIEPNLQNIPVRTEIGKIIRKAFVPEKDSVLLSCDYSQIELRVLAHISKCNDLKNAFLNHEDIHKKVASDIYSVPIEAVTDNMRRNAKAVIFGIVYGISGYGLGENLDINPKEGKELINKYLSMYPGVKKYMEDIKTFAYKNYYVKTLLGRIRYIDELKNTNYMIRNSGERIALNTPIQGSSADIIKLAMIKVNKYLKDNKLKSTMLLQVHDELIFNVYKDELKKVKKDVSKIMENIYELIVPLKVSVGVGNNWYNTK